MKESKKSAKEYRDFQFRRRHDHLLRFQLSEANQDEIIKTAKELGFNINANSLKSKVHTIAKSKSREQKRNYLKKIIWFDYLEIYSFCFLAMK